MARAAAREAVSHFANAIDCSKRLDDVPGGAERIARLHLAMASALVQSGDYRSERLGEALDDARRAAANTALVELQCEVVLSIAAFSYATGRNRDYLTLADEQLENHADLLSPAYVSALWSTKGTAHFNRAEWRFAIEAMRKARDLIDRTDASRRILLGGGDQLIPTQHDFFRSLVAMGFIDEAVETAERFVQTIDRMEKPLRHRLGSCDEGPFMRAARPKRCATAGRCEDHRDQRTPWIHRPDLAAVFHCGDLRARDWVNWMPASTMPAREWCFGVVRAWYLLPRIEYAGCVIFWCRRAVSRRHRICWMRSMPSLSIPTKLASWLNASAFAAKSPLAQTI